MAERTAEEVAQIFTAAGDSVTLINRDTAKEDNETEQDWKDRIKRNTDHLELIKEYKKEDGTTSIWTTEDFTDIDAAIVSGKALIA
jgi:pyruvate/2-oxoglutarate dehydrogenase complex dihydrolipoamide dehydrogenase (E3) component